MRLTEVELFYQELLPTLRKPDVWERMMKQISPFWRFGSFSEAMLLTEQNPKATAVATYEQWNKMGRYVKKGSLSTIVFTGINDTSPKYLFDISQTYGRPILPKWKMNEQYSSGIISRYNAENGANVTNLSEYIQKSIDKNIIRIYNYNGKLTPQMQNDPRIVELICLSARTICLKRCNISEADMTEEFSIVSQIRNDVSMMEIGNLSLALAQDVLREIDRQIRSMEYERDKQNDNVRGSGMRNTLRGEERNTVSEAEQLRTGEYVTSRAEGDGHDDGNGQRSAGVREHERSLQNDLGADSESRRGQQNGQAERAESSDNTQRGLSDARVAANDDIQTGAGSGMGNDTDVRELADSESEGNSDNSGDEEYHPLYDDPISETDTTESDEAGFTEEEKSAFSVSDDEEYGQLTLFSDKPDITEAAERFDAAALLKQLLTETDRITGPFEKHRIKYAYEDFPNEFADKLKEILGVGMRYGSGDIKYIEYNEQGILAKLADKSILRYEWTDAARTAAELIDSGRYITDAETAFFTEQCINTLRNADRYVDPDIASSVESAKWRCDYAIRHLESVGYDTTPIMPEFLKTIYAAMGSRGTFLPDNEVSIFFGDREENSDWFTESTLFRDFALTQMNGQVSFALANAVLEYLDEKQHIERIDPTLSVGYYHKTNLYIKAVIGDDSIGYECRFDIGDGKGSGGGSLIDHIKQFCEYYYENNPLKLPEEEQAGYKQNLDILVPFLLEHSQLTDEEQRILDDFKQAHPISRTPCTAAYAALMNGANIIPLEYRNPNAETKIDGYHPIADASSPKLSDLKLVRTDEGNFNITGTSNGFSGRHENCILNTFENIDSAFEYITTNERMSFAPITDEPQPTAQPEPKPRVSPDILKVGDLIRLDGKVWRITDIDGDFSLSFENTDKNDMEAVGSIYGRWKQNLEKQCFELVSSNAQPKDTNQRKKLSVTKKGSFYELVGDEDTATQDANLLGTIPIRGEYGGKLGIRDIDIDRISEQLKDNGFIVEAAETVETAEKETTEPLTPVVPKQTPKAQNYSFPDDFTYSHGKKAKYQDNIAAIKTLLNIERERRFATPEEQTILAHYSGWGGIPEAFDSDKSDWSSEYVELKSLLSEKEYNAARASTTTAFYTEPYIIQSIYKALEHFGFKGGHIIDPAMGTGNFFGNMPRELAENSTIYGVELDSLTARIAHYLYPLANIQNKGYQNTKFEDNTFDVVVGNVPFGEYSPYDAAYKEEYLIHDYFFIKSLDKLKAGGIAALITSSGTLDKMTANPRIEMYRRAELIGALRLPNNAFGSAGTQVVTDIIFFKKRDRILEETFSSYETRYRLPAWVKDGGGYFQHNGNSFYDISAYYAEHPEHLLGTPKLVSARYGNVSTIEADGNTAERLEKAVLSLNGEFAAAPTLEELDTEEQISYTPLPEGVRPFTYFTDDSGKLFFGDHHGAAEYTGDKKSAEAIKQMTVIVQQLDELIAIQRDGCTDELLTEKQAVLNSLYDSFVKKYGCLNTQTNLRRFSDDIRAPKLSALEIERRNEKDEPYFDKADIFFKRTINQFRTPDHADTAIEALHISLNLKQQIDLHYMAALCGKSEDEVINELGDMIFCNPARNSGDKYSGWETADEYLSGHTREKVGLAMVKAEENPEMFSRNVAALKEHQPPTLGISDISFRLGSMFIPAEMFTQFIYDTFETARSNRSSGSFAKQQISCEYLPALNEWRIPNKGADSNVKVDQEYGTRRLNAYELTELCLNQRRATVKDKETYRDEKGLHERYVVNKKETILAREKQARIEQAFVQWVLADESRVKRIENIYNDRFNNITPRHYDGSYIDIPGMAAGVTLRPHQKDVIARFAATGGGLMAHEVGAGKTAASAGLGMYLKSIGAITKPLFVVPNAVIGQFGEEFQRFFPSANILVATEKDFQKLSRRRFLAKISSNDFDAIIVSQSQFEKMPMSLERQEEYFDRRIEELTQTIEMMKADKGERLSIKRLESMRFSLQTKIEKLRAAAKKDDFISFEDLGCDYLIIDEAHNYKNLALFSKMTNVAGINTNSNSQRAFDLELKIRYMQEINNGGGVCLMTGTPISNAISEMFVWQYLLQYRTLQQLGIEYFDNWASVFGNITQTMEVKPSGTGFRMRTRFANFVNLPELCNLFGEVTDIVKTADLDLKLPSVAGGKPQLVICEPSPAQEEQRDEGMERARKIENKEVKPEEDNMLAICTFMTKVALDGRILNPAAEDYEGSKVNNCVRNILDIGESNPGTAQVVFCDTNTPKYDGTFTVYEDIKAKLVASGRYSEDEIAFVHDAHNDRQRIELFDKVNQAQVRVIIGSTGKLGTGVNIQKHLVAMHHLDAPYRPSDIEQRNGRGIRQGNELDEVHVFYYATKGTFDTYRWQLLEKKQEIASKVLSGKPVSRSCEDIDETALTFAEMKAATTDNPLIAEKLTVDNEVARLMLLQSDYLSEHKRLETDITKMYPTMIENLTRQRDNALADIQTFQQHPFVDDSFVIEINGKTYTEKEKAAEMIEAQVQAYMGTNEASEHELLLFGKYHGFEIGIRRADALTMHLVLKGKNSYRNDYANSGTGAITKLDNLLQKLENEPERLAESIAKNETQLKNAQTLYEQPFEHTEELARLIEKQSAINAELEFGKAEEQVLDEDAEENGAEEMEA